MDILPALPPPLIPRSSEPTSFAFKGKRRDGNLVDNAHFVVLRRPDWYPGIFRGHWCCPFGGYRNEDKASRVAEIAVEDGIAVETRVVFGSIEDADILVDSLEMSRD